MYDEMQLNAIILDSLSFAMCQIQLLAIVCTHMQWHIYRPAEAVLCLGAQTDW